MSELAKALADFQAELPRIGRGNVANAGTFSYRYADLADINEVVLPLLGKHGLSFSAKPTIHDGRFVLAYTLRHSGGESDSGEYPLPDPTKTSPQQIGSAISYARRYVFCAVTGVAPGGDDDDGAAAAPATRERVEQQWDPIEQQTLLNSWMAEIEDAKDSAELDDISRRLVLAKKPAAGDDQISPATFDHLKIAGARRRGELNGHGKKLSEGVSASAQVETLPSL